MKNVEARDCGRDQLRDQMSVRMSRSTDYSESIRYLLMVDIDGPGYAFQYVSPDVCCRSHEQVVSGDAIYDDGAAIISR